MSNHDTRYRDLFSHVDMVRALFMGILQACVDDDTVLPSTRTFDWDEAQMLQSGFVSDDLQQRHSDCVWRIPYRDAGAVYMLLLLEHQSQVDFHMALRVLVYTGLLYQSLIKQGQITRHDVYPPILPVVIYSGLRPWSAATALADQFAPTSALQHLQPAMSYILLDEGVLLRRKKLPRYNPATLLFRLEHCADIEEFEDLVQTIGRRLHRHRYTELRRSFVSWLKATLWPRLVEDVDIGHIQSLQELSIMLIEEKPRFSEQWRKQGLEQGREEGREQGIQIGQATVLKRQLMRRFGALDPALHARIDAATPTQLETWSLNVLDARALDDVFQNQW